MKSDSFVPCGIDANINVCYYLPEWYSVFENFLLPVDDLSLVSDFPHFLRNPSHSLYIECPTIAWAERITAGVDEFYREKSIAVVS